MFRLMQTSLPLALASLLLAPQAQAGNDSPKSELPQPNTSQLNTSPAAERPTLTPAASQGSFSAADMKRSKQLTISKISERDRIILQYQLQRVIPVEQQR